MLFMATQSSTQQTSPDHDAERQAAIRHVLSNAGQNGVVMRGIYVNANAHTVYFLFEADNADQIARVFAPIVHLGHVESVPVIDRLEL